MSDRSVYLYMSDISVLYSGQTNDEKDRFRRHRKEHPMCKDNPDGVFKVVAENLTQEESNDLERIWIEMFDLTNEGYNKHRSFGGTNMMTDETRTKISERQRGRKLSDEHRKAISQGLKGIIRSEEHQAKLTKSQQGRKNTPEARQKMSKAKMGIKLSDEHRKNISRSLTGRKISDEHRKNISKGAKGIIPNYNARVKMSVSRKRFVINKRKKNDKTAIDNGQLTIEEIA